MFDIPASFDVLCRGGFDCLDRVEGIRKVATMQKWKEEREKEKKKMRGNDISSSEIQVSKVNMQIFRDNNERETKPSAPRAPFVTKLYSSLPKTGRVVLGDITRNYSPNRLVPGKYLIRPVSSSKGEENPQKRSEGGTNSNSSNNNRTSILKVR